MLGRSKRIEERLLGEFASVRGVLAVGIFDPEGGVLIRQARGNAEETLLRKLGPRMVRLFHLRARHHRNAVCIDLAFEARLVSARQRGGLTAIVLSSPDTDVSLLSRMGEDALKRAEKIKGFRQTSARNSGTPGKGPKG